MVQKRIIKVVSFALAIWYLLCVVGFDVHTCCHSGKSFVSSLVVGVTCDDIHPESGCCHDSCCGHHGLAGRKCCTDDIRILSLTGDSRVEGDTHHHHHHCDCLCGHCPVLADISVRYSLSEDQGMPSALPDLPFRAGFPDNIQSVFSVWRI